MPTLILLRHGKAVRETEAPTDEARRLTDRGRREAAQAGERIIAARLKPDVALVSPAERTRETAACALAAMPGVPTTIVDGLYMAVPETIWDAAAAAFAGGAETVLVIGHNPGLSELTAMLIEQDNDGSRLARDLSEGLSTAAFAAFDIRGDVLDAAAPRLVAGGRPA
ncbi:MAG: histidine phosphatase family protein [Alphaproteobacteria bacterium]|nr:histidine phosphatase family protein [Alphaproteobacteria bacterium]